MKLDKYLAERSISLSAFAREIGAGHATVVKRYVDGRVPHPSMMQAIVAATNGAVQPNDFYAETN